MKIYYTETQADFDALMVELEDQGYLWSSGHKPTESTMKKAWGLHEKDTRVMANREKELLFGGAIYHKENYPDAPTVNYKATQDGHSIKLTVDYVSDLHLNHHCPFSHNQEKWKRQTVAWTNNLLLDATGQVLIVAGDLSEWNVQTQWFLEECSKHYNQVFITAGNHDYYLRSNNQREKYKDHSRHKQQSRVKLEEMFHHASALPNVTVLHGHVVTYNGFVFGGHSLWYKPTSYFGDDEEWYKNSSNDRRFISVGRRYPQENYDILFDEAIAWYNTQKDTVFDVFVSHVPPVDPLGRKNPNSCYVATLPFLVDTKYWICGHQHEQMQFNERGVQFLMNAVGYPSENHDLTVRTFTLEK